MIIKIQFHFPIRLFFKAEKMLIIDLHHNESPSSTLTFSPPADTLLWPFLFSAVVPSAFLSTVSLPSPQTNLHNVLLPLLLFPDIFLQLSHAPISVTGVYSCSPHSFSRFPVPWAGRGEWSPEDASPLSIWDRRPSAISFHMEHLWVTTQDKIITEW